VGSSYSVIFSLRGLENTTNSCPKAIAIASSESEEGSDGVNIDLVFVGCDGVNIELSFKGIDDNIDGMLDDEGMGEILGDRDGIVDNEGMDEILGVNDGTELG